jgi:hypothetical protein
MLKNSISVYGQKPRLKLSFKNSISGPSRQPVVRVRPRLSHEVESNYFESVLVSNPSVAVLEPGFSVKGDPKLQARVQLL